MPVPTALTSPVLYLQVRHGEEEIYVVLENLLKELLPLPELQLLLLHLLRVQAALPLLHVGWGGRRGGSGQEGLSEPSCPPQLTRRCCAGAWVIPLCSALLFFSEHSDLVALSGCDRLEWQHHQHLLCRSLRPPF